MGTLHEPDDVDFVVAGGDSSPESVREALEFIRKDKARPEYAAELQEAMRKLAAIGIDTTTFGTSEDPGGFREYWRRTVEELRDERQSGPNGRSANHLAGTFHSQGSNEIRLDNFEVSWAGECPWRNSLCFGSNDGRIKFTDSQGIESPSQFPPVVDSDAAINGVAFSEAFMAVSTPNEIALVDVPYESEGRKVRRALINGGAYGVIATGSGRFVAPMGIGGFLLIDPRSGERKTVMAQGVPLNFYSTTSLGSTQFGGDVLAFAARKSGLAWTVISRAGGSDGIGLLSHPGVDVVDVCSLGGELPFAVVTVGTDRTLSFSRDILTDQRLLSLRIDGLQGVAYRVFSSLGHIFLQTSEYLYVVFDLASRFVEGQPIDGLATRVRAYKLRVVDVDLAYDKLLLVLPDRVISVKLASLADDGRGVDTIEAAQFRVLDQGVGPGISNLPSQTLEGQYPHSTLFEMNIT
jgi:hypothetical protein